MESKKLEYITFVSEHREKTKGDGIIYLLLLLISKIDVYILLLGTVQISCGCPKVRGGWKVVQMIYHRQERL